MIINILLLVLFSRLTYGDPIQQCGNWDTYKDEKCIKVFDNNYVLNYANARTTCRQNDAYLVSIHSQEEYDFLLNLIYNVHKIVNEVWIGAEYKSKMIKWSDNITTSYTNWSNGYPKEVSGYECVSIGFDDPNHGKWLNDPCEKVISYVCEKRQNWLSLYMQSKVMEIRENMTNYFRNTSVVLQNTKIEFDNYKSELKQLLSNKDCSISEVWIKCQQFIDFRTNQRQVIAIPKALNEKFLTRENALNVCAKYNATLVSIETPEKQLFLENFVNSNRTIVWTSGYSSAEDKKWRWINGHEITYTDWDDRQPDNGYPIEPCLEFHHWSTNKWNDINCDVENLVLCEFDY